MASQLNIAINWDASAVGAVLPTVNSVGRPLKKGDAVLVTGTGTVAGKKFTAKDVIIVLQTKPTSVEHFGDVDSGEAGASISLEDVQDKIEERLPYKEWVARLNQVGTGNLTAMVYNAAAPNFLEGVTLLRDDVMNDSEPGDSPGVYYIKFANPAPARNKVFFMVSEGGTTYARDKVQVAWDAVTQGLQVSTYDFNGDNLRWDLADNLLTAPFGLCVVVRVYN